MSDSISDDQDFIVVTTRAFVHHQKNESNSYGSPNKKAANYERTINKGRNLKEADTNIIQSTKSPKSYRKRKLKKVPTKPLVSKSPPNVEDEIVRKKSKTTSTSSSSQLSELYIEKENRNKYSKSSLSSIFTKTTQTYEEIHNEQNEEMDVVLRVQESNRSIQSSVEIISVGEGSNNSTKHEEPMEVFVPMEISDEAHTDLANALDNSKPLCAVKNAKHVSHKHTEVLDSLDSGTFSVIESFKQTGKPTLPETGNRLKLKLQFLKEVMEKLEKC